MSDRITWESCPGCGQLLAVGWIGDDPVEWDCVAGCELTQAQIRALPRVSGGRPALT